MGQKLFPLNEKEEKQLSLGAKLAQGAYLLFLHADCQFTKPVDLRRAIKEGFAWGFFPIKYEPTNLELKLLSAWINFRSKVFALPFGDQGLLVKHALYEEVGGFKDYPFLEDVDLVLRLRKKGRPKFFPVSLTVSSRKLKPHIPFYPTFHSL
ncbi:MAG: hypothetical protein LM579_01575 [Thermodesulfobacterium sp.]|nr:hypothetical protein [Thermodesulfobacterium sp.]